MNTLIVTNRYTLIKIFEEWKAEMGDERPELAIEEFTDQLIGRLKAFNGGVPSAIAVVTV